MCADSFTCTVPVMGMARGETRGLRGARGARGEPGSAVAIPAFLRAALDTHRESAARGQAPALAATTRVLSQVEGYLASGLEDDPFLVLQLPDDSTDWRDRASTLVNEVIRPAFSEYRDGLRRDIAPVSRPDEKCGLAWMAGGEEIYSALVDQYVQLPVTPEEIHRIGTHWATEVNAAEWVVEELAAIGIEADDHGMVEGVGGLGGEQGGRGTVHALGSGASRS